MTRRSPARDGPALAVEGPAIVHGLAVVEGPAVIDGLAVVDKPAGMTSHDVVARCRRIFGQRKVGHAGTLDPDATGVLLVGLGQATRLLQFQSGLPKSYIAGIVLGVATTTLDAAGEVTGRWDQRHVSLEDIRRAAAQLTGTIWQTPPMVSAVKVGGRPLHELARQGLEVDRAPRQVEVTCFEVESMSPDEVLDARRSGDGCGAGLAGEEAEETAPGPVLSVRVDCSAGTYIRVLAADLGAALGGGAHVRWLRRTAIGPWTEAMATGLDELSAANVLPPAASLPWLDAVAVDAELAREIEHGRVLGRPEFTGQGHGPWRMVGPGGDLLAIYQNHGADRVKPAVVLPRADRTS
jgi:tRNA pseudouridine55 synthase